MELEGGEIQTIYYISDTKGHRISINVPFDEIKVKSRPAPTRKPQNHAESKRRFNLAIDENRLYEENRIDENQRQGRIQASRKIDIPKVEVKSKAEDVAKPVEEVVEEVKTDNVKVEDEIKSEDDTPTNDDIQTEDDEKPEEQVNEEEKPEHDDHSEESAKDYDEK